MNSKLLLLILSEALFMGWYNMNKVKYNNTAYFHKKLDLNINNLIKLKFSNSKTKN